MDRFPEELELEQRFRDGVIKTPGEGLTRLMQVYDLVIGWVGREIFEKDVVPELLSTNKGDINAAGLKALALLAEASLKPPKEVDSFLNSCIAERNPGKGSSLERAVNSINPDYTLPVLIYSNDSRFKRASVRWIPVYRSSTANRRHQRIATGMPQKRLSIEIIIGAESARITGRALPAGYTGEIDGNEFSLEKSNHPLVIVYGHMPMPKNSQKHDLDEYGFLYMVTSQGTRHLPGRNKYAQSVEIPAVTTVFAVLPQRDYEGLIINQFKDVEQFTLNMLPNEWKDYLTNGRYFKKPKVIGEIGGGIGSNKLFVYYFINRPR